MMDTRNLRLAAPDRNGFTLFLGEDRYGQTMTIKGFFKQGQIKAMSGQLQNCKLTINAVVSIATL